MKGIKKLNKFAAAFIILGLLGLMLSFCLTGEALKHTTFITDFIDDIAAAINSSYTSNNQLYYSIKYWAAIAGGSLLLIGIILTFISFHKISTKFADSTKSKTKQIVVTTSGSVVETTSNSKELKKLNKAAEKTAKKQEKAKEKLAKAAVKAAKKAAKETKKAAIDATKDVVNEAGDQTVAAVSNTVKEKQKSITSILDSMK